MPFPTKLPTPGLPFEELLVYAASEMAVEELDRFIAVLEDEVGRSHTAGMIKAVDRLHRRARVLRTAGDWVARTPAVRH
jgi:hypothetical protein